MVAPPGLARSASAGTTFNRDFGAENEERAQAPGVSVFVREDALVRYFYSGRPDLSPRQSERGIDLLSPVWQVLDLPGGRGDWYGQQRLHPGRPLLTGQRGLRDSVRPGRRLGVRRRGSASPDTPDLPGLRED
ncbi:uncharacterized protein DUF899 [Saccharopolyspora spinosa]|uniref:Uncharacterized protein DUF899 n=1 Tax=Saccharopolyspora spinosa TaxID=60894 RepID=A0A2N3Y4L4_SACSN|nr:uncharacterized protein DUF899 [Saccharopolyspora spinosa]